MHVIEQDEQLDREREQRAPRPKSKVRSNPAHLNANPGAFFRETGGGFALETCVGTSEAAGGYPSRSNPRQYNRYPS
jgi:hypothetical protein